MKRHNNLLNEPEAADELKSVKKFSNNYCKKEKSTQDQKLFIDHLPQLH